MGEAWFQKMDDLGYYGLWTVYTGKSYYRKNCDLVYYGWFIMDNPITVKWMI